MTPHPNNMTVWDTIACQRAPHGAHEHVRRRVHVDLSEHAYHDYPQVPAPLVRGFDMLVYDPTVHPVDGGPYCPAHDAVSATIKSHGIWEPRETILTLTALDSPTPGTFIDFGSQVGWFSLLALSCGRDVIAVEADHDNVSMLAASASLNEWSNQLTIIEERVSDAWESVLPDERVCLAKIDVEGAEDVAVESLWPLIEQGKVDHMLIEISPVFDDYYGDLVCRIVDAGFDAYLLPPKMQPPWPLDILPGDLLVGRLPRDGLKERINGWHQENVWFARRGAW